METFEGTGYECLGKMIENKWKGRLLIDGAYHIKNGYGVLADYHMGQEISSLDWLEKPCKYVFPEIKWCCATPGDALNAVLRGDTIQAKGEKYIDWITVDAKTMKAWDWLAPGFRFRVEVEDV